MNTLKFENDILNCLAVLQSGGLILYPTDTIWGIGCDATNASAVRKIYDLKKRPDEKSMIILVADEKQITKHVSQPEPGIFDYLKTMQKPTTVVYDGAIGLADNLIGSDGTIAIRICRDEFCKHLLKRFRKPVVSTSANISGLSFPANFSEISDHIRDGVDYIVHFRQDEMVEALPSSLIRWKKGVATILRP